MTYTPDQVAAVQARWAARGESLKRAGDATTGFAMGLLGLLFAGVMLVSLTLPVLRWMVGL